MAQLPFNAFSMLSAPGIRGQVGCAVEALTEVLPGPNAPGQAYKICDLWQRRLELALRSEIPDWAGLAAFRHSLDYTLSEEVLEALRRAGASPSSAADCPRELATVAECWQAYDQYFNQGRDLHSGKFLLCGAAAEWFQAQASQCRPTLGGQAGNILWLWRCLGADAKAYTPYLSKPLTNLAFKPAQTQSDSIRSSTRSGSTLRDGSPVSPHINDPRSRQHLAQAQVSVRSVSPNPLDLTQNPSFHKTPLADSQFLWLNGNQNCFKYFAEARAFAGVRRGDNSVIDAPTSASFTIAKEGRRLIYSLPGFRPLTPEAARPPEQACFIFKGQPTLDQVVACPANTDSWPAAPLFSECHINAEGMLEITLADEAQLAAAVAGQVDYAVIGGMDAIFYDPWLQTDPQLQARLLNILEKQLKALSECGVRIGVELSGIPRREYAHFVKDLCHEGVIVALGINGVDELPNVTGKASLDMQLFDWWFDPNQVPAELREQERNHFEYLTYLRAKQLANVTGVRTLYVHTMTLDFILRRDADPGALLRAQLGDMMGKGLVIAALLQRNYDQKWFDALKEMPPAVNPKAMARLGQFASDFEKHENIPSSRDRLLTSGYRLAASPDEYSVAVVPVVWPHVSDEQVGNGLPENMNPTGAGDMAFGAFFLLGGV